MTAFPRVIVLAATHGLMVVSGAAPFEPNAPSTAVAGDRHVDGMTLLVPSQLGVTRATVGYVLIGLLVVGWVVVIGVRVRRHRARRAAPPSPMTETEPRASRPGPGPVRETPRTQDPGWYWDPDHMTEQAYWDGQSWTARRRWDGNAWVDVKVGPPS